jgi:glucosamine--fructose-6-phosphate aminotransferase (isomerizing)
MCGIVGYLGNKEAMPILLDGLQRLEYRGYDSAGMAVMSAKGLEIRRSVGKLKELEAQLLTAPLYGTVGIGHTRWATHGRPTETNAHPHQVGHIAVVHNGIIENYLELKKQLIDEGHTFTSETDTEIIAQLIYKYSSQGAGFVEAVRLALQQVRGSYAIVVINAHEPRTIIGTRK